MDNHTCTLVLIILFCAFMMTQSYFQREGYRNVRVTHAKIPKRNVFSKSFNIDHHLKCEPNNLAWKGFWRKNYASFSNNLDKVYSDKENKTMPPLLFDGVRNPNSCPL